MRKSWSLLLVFLIVSMLIIMLNPGTNYLHWLPVVVPLSAFHAAAFYYLPGRWFPSILHWVIFGFAIMLNYYGARSAKLGNQPIAERHQ